MIDHVTRQQFVQGLSRLGIEPSASEIELLCKKYDDDGIGSLTLTLALALALAPAPAPTLTLTRKRQLRCLRAHGRRP
jgi:hypothetical protein